MLPWILVSLVHLTLSFRSDAECMVEENSRSFSGECDLKKLFPDIESPNVDNFRNIFRLSGTKVELLQTLDRESLITSQKCDPGKLSHYMSRGQCVLILELSGAGPRFYQLSILISDVNDNVPSFDRLLYSIKIAENSPSNVEVDLPQARDPDRGRNGTVSYHIQKGDSSHKFVLLNPSSNSAIDSPLKLKILHPFDREVEEEVQLVVVARDHGLPPKSSSLVIKIEIMDINDHAPEFNQSSYRFNVPESVLQGQPLGRVFAFDRDVSSRISTMISPSASSDIMDRFVVSSDGVVSTKTSLEYTSNNDEFRIPVLAMDGGTPVLTATTTVLVHVTDVNDHSPSVEVTSIHSNNRLLLMENCVPDTYIAKVSARDQDQGPNGQVDCSLDPGQQHLFRLDHIQTFDHRRYYKLVTARLSVFDRETKDSHSLVIICRDLGEPPLTSTRLLTILVQDQNDNAPLFPQSHLSVKLLENQPGGTTLVTLKALDLDLGANSKTQYRLLGDSSSLFSLDPNTGTVTTKRPFDRELVSSVVFEAMAFDRVLPGLHSNVTVHVTILDENDNAPRFIRGLAIHIPENRDGLVGRVEAIDDDEGRNREVEYFLIQASDTFQVSRSGEVLVYKKDNLDRERMDHYSLEVGARDRGLRPLSSSTVVEVFVEDVNDNAPTFILPRQSGLHINVSIQTPPGTRVFTVEASDSDLGLNSKIMYSIRPLGIFVINSSDGGIFLNKTLSTQEAADGPLKVLIFAKDCGSPPLTSKSSIILNYVHNGAPRLVSQDKKTEPRTTSSRDLILSLGIGMVLLIFTCLMMLVTYFCVSIFIQKRRHQMDHEQKSDHSDSRTNHWLCFRSTRRGDRDRIEHPGTLEKMKTVPQQMGPEREDHYPMCFNRWDKTRVVPGSEEEEDPLYTYREFTMKPLANQSPRIYERLSSTSNPYWQYNTIGHFPPIHRPSFPSSPSQDVPELIYHHGVTYMPSRSHPDLLNSNYSGPPLDDKSSMYLEGGVDLGCQGGLKMNMMMYYPQTKQDIDKLKEEDDENTKSRDETLGTTRFAGYVLGSPRYSNSFV